MENILTAMNIKTENFGTSYGQEAWVKAKNNGIIESINPSTEELIATVHSASQKDYEIIVREAYEAFLLWRTVPAPKRGEIVRQIGEALREKKQMLGHLVTLEMGKSLQEGLGEVQEMIDMADLAVGQSRMLYGKTMHSERKNHRMYEQWHPLGPVGIITAFNFPIAVWAWNALLAAVCGNTVIWKPSSKTPLCAVAVQHICNSVMAANNLKGIFNLIVSEDSKVKQNLVNDKRIPLISFTGSSHAGKIVAEQVAKRMGRTLLECSGNNAIIVDRTADFELAIPSIVFGAVGTAGQRCTSTRRLILHEAIFEEILLQLSKIYRNIKIGNPLDNKNLMGPLIDAKAVHAYEKAIAEIEKQGGKIITGGKRLKQTGFFVEPTIAIAENVWSIVQQETFAPILYVMAYTDIEQAIALQNGVDQGLSSAIFTRDIQHAEMFLAASGSDCGIANVNIGTSGAEIGGAFGGEKSTGGGREAGSDSWKAYMRRQTNTINWSRELPLSQGIKFTFD